MGIKNFLEKTKYFGLRKIYYFLNFNYYLYLLKDIFKPSLNNRFFSKKICGYFQADDGHNLSKDRSFLGFGQIHYSLIRNLKPAKVLCLGSRYGFIPAICALACKDNGRGLVDFVDAGFDEKHLKSFTGVGFWKKTKPQKYFSRFGLKNYLRFYLMLSKEFARKFPKRKYDYVYIDGDHSYEGVKKDYRLFWSRLKKGGFMVFHDVVMRGKDPATKQPYGIWKFWEELPEDKKITFPFPKNSGLGLLQK
jgi:hypothetical protein